jgi:branched-chain amino acid aminotransferase
MAPRIELHSDLGYKRTILNEDGLTYMNTYYVDGKFVPADQAMIPVDDLAILRGIGVFDLLRTYGGKPLFLSEHVARLRNSAREINLDIPWSHEEICAVALETVSRNQLDEANIRIIVTGGSSPDFLNPVGKPRLIVMVTPLAKLPQWWYEKGVKVITMRSERHIPDAKSINYLPAAMALRQAQAQNAIEVIYLDRNGNALEGATSNLFVFSGDTLVTPGRGILSGITRKAVLEVAGKLFGIEIRNLHRKELFNAQEVFLTGTNKGLVPVVQIDDSMVADGHPGPRTLKIMAALQAHTNRVIDNSNPR